MKELPMCFSIKAVVTFVLLIMALEARADEGLPNCTDSTLTTDLEAPCTLQWIDHQNLQRMIWSQDIQGYNVEDGLSVEISMEEDGRYHIKSQFRPDLMDFDQDGWTDLVFFVPNGIVNGNYELFRFNPDHETFLTMGEIYGYHLFFDKTGFIVAVSRSSCCSSSANFYSKTGQQLNLEIQMDIWSVDTPKPAEQCKILQGSNGSDADALRADYPDLIADYCNYYKEKGWEAIEARSLDLEALSAAVNTVPDDTVFYCQLEDDAYQVAVTHRDGVYTYQYGFIGQPPEVELRQATDQVQILQSNGEGKSRSGYLELQNGDYVYQVYYLSQLALDNDIMNVTEIDRGLTVRRGDETAYILEKKCLPNASFDGVFQLD
ncbi:MAG: hypothetical protein ACI9RO_001708 [Alteromonas macleodii]|jgi:hypothetical protein